MVAKKRIYIAYTGGTIGMKPSAKGFAPCANFLSNALQGMPEFFREEMPEFTLHEYDSLLDSSDMKPSDWLYIANDIARHYDDYDGFIILHGTDTMAYTASALSFILEHLSKPVIVTGSQIPISELRSDGKANLLNALYLAAYHPIPEVTLFFNNRLFRGCRSRKVDADGFDAFDSPNFPFLIEAGINIEINRISNQIVDGNALNVSNIESQPVAMLSLYPGMDAKILENILRQPVKALILMSYGVGNAPQDAMILNLLKYAYKQEILVVNCTQCMRGKVNMSGYATGTQLAEMGVVSGADMTPEAALSKLHYLLSKPDLSFKQRRGLMAENLRGELTV